MIYIHSSLTLESSSNVYNDFRLHISKYPNFRKG